MRFSRVDRPRPLGLEATKTLLGIDGPVPMTERDMARAVRVAYFVRQSEPRLDAFRDSLDAAFGALGVSIVDFAETLNEKGRVQAGVSLISFGEGKVGELAVDFVPTLYDNPLVGVVFKPAPVSSEMSPQQILDILSADLVWHMIHIIVYVTERTWTCCTMNGAIVTGTYGAEEPNRIAEALVPKLAAPIRPLRVQDFEVFKTEEESLTNGHCRSQIDDMVSGASLFRENGLFPSQTRARSLSYQNRLYRRIGSSFLDKRTGMSYGFIARQLPMAISPAVPLGHDTADSPPIFSRGADGRRLAVITMDETRYAVDVPEVTVLCTRSGCDKGNVDPLRDVVKLSLKGCGSMSFFATKEVGENEAKPSYDTRVILAHALGNGIIASLLAHLSPDAEFLWLLRTEGLAIAHWHNHLTRDEIPAGLSFHGDTNPAVSCASPQAAIFALQGKLEAFAALEPAARHEYKGDVHVEPHHGTNVVHSSLVKIAEWSTAPQRSRVAIKREELEPTESL